MKSKPVFEVRIKWKHGDATKTTTSKIEFESSFQMSQFLQFIYEVRRFIPNKGYANVGYFSDGHYERERKWVEKVASKYNPAFLDYMKYDLYFGQDSEYYPAIGGIHVRLDGKVHHIVWEKALETNLIELPNKGDMFETNTGKISNCGKMFGQDTLHYNDLRNIYDEVGKDEYKKMHVRVIDVLITKYIKYQQFSSFEYLVLAEIPEGRVTTSFYGYDPSYEVKYNKAKYNGFSIFKVK